MRGGIFPGDVEEVEARALIEAEPPMDGRDLAKEVTPREVAVLEPTGGGAGPRIVAIDTGIKSSIVANLRRRGATVELHPCSATADGSARAVCCQEERSVAGMG